VVASKKTATYLRKVAIEFGSLQEKRSLLPGLLAAALVVLISFLQAQQHFGCSLK